MILAYQPVFAQATGENPSPVALFESVSPANVEYYLNNMTLLPNSILHRVWTSVFIILISYIILFALVSLVNKKVPNIRVRHIIRRYVVYFINFLLIFIIFFIWIQKLNTITIFLGVASAGLALALQEVLLCAAGWFLIISRRPFEVGDRIEIGNIKGDVIDIRLLQTSLLEIGNWVSADQSTGRIVNVPNSAVYKSANYNYSRGFEFIWNEFPIVVTFESDWPRAKDIMLRHANDMVKGMEDHIRRKIDAMRNRYMIYYGKLTPIVYVNIKDSGVELTLRYLTEAKKRRSSQDQLCQAILTDFAEEERVNFAYPTYRIVKT